MSEFRQLGKTDVLFVAGETDRVYQHTAGLVLLEYSDRRDFDFQVFRQHVVERVGLIPHFRWKLHEVPFALDLPYWIEDEQFSFDHHIKRIAVPSPGDREALGEVVAHLYSKHLDRSRPLWEIWFIEGLQDGQFAILQKLHHCMMDGQGASKLGEIMCDFEPEAEPQEIDRAIANARPGERPSNWELSINTARRLAGLPREITGEILQAAGPALRQRLSGEQKPEREKTNLPIASFNAEIGSDRGFVFGSLPLADFKVIKNHFDVTVNDVVLAVVGGSMREYLLAHDALPEAALRAGIAVSLRTEEDDQFSNKVTNTSVTLATDLHDPVERLRAIHVESGAATVKARGGGKGIVEIMQMMPPLLVNAMMNMMPPEQVAGMMGANLIVSNVRGSDRPMYIGGARMATMYPMSIISPGMGINVTCVSYAGAVDFGITVEPDLFPQPWEIIDGLRRSLAEYLGLVGGKKKKPSRRKSAARKTTGGRKKAAARKKAPVRKQGG
jgi:WS/DGAT/MGAT family acyltransferase